MQDNTLLCPDHSILLTFFSAKSCTPIQCCAFRCRHNNHHGMPSSARHGMEWWEFDLTWTIIRGLQAVGLASNVKLPTEQQKARLAF